MNVLEAIEARRAIKFFDPAHRMTQQEEDRLMNAVRLTPTAFNIQHGRYVIVRDPALRRQIREVAWNQAQMTDASLLVVVCADIMAWSKQPERYWSHAPEAVRDGLVSAMRQYYTDHHQVQRDEAMRTCGLAAMTLMLAAQDLGYDSCPLDGFDFDAVARLIDLPDDHLISMIVAVGKRTEAVWPRGDQLPADEVIFEDRFPQS